MCRKRIETICVVNSWKLEDFFDYHMKQYCGSRITEDMRAQLKKMLQEIGYIVKARKNYTDEQGCYTLERIDKDD